MKKIEKRGYKHGMRYHPTNRVWNSMKTRCDNHSNKFFHYYGGRGITYDLKWKNFISFWEDMGPTYKKGLEIDRIDNNSDYCKKNCKWSTRKEQQNNRRSCVLLSFEGKTLNVSQWSDKLKINRQSIFSRLRYGWSVEKTLSTSTKKYK